MRRQTIHESDPATGKGVFGLPHRAADALDESSFAALLRRVLD